MPENGQLVAELQATGSRMALITGAIAGPRELGGSGGVSWISHSLDLVDVELR